MSDLAWLQFVEQTVARLLPAEADRADVLDRLRERPGYRQAYVQRRCGATPRVIELLIRRELIEMGAIAE